jgi:peptide/nickel transport system permease protein
MQISIRKKNLFKFILKNVFISILLLIIVTALSYFLLQIENLSSTGYFKFVLSYTSWLHNIIFYFNFGETLNGELISYKIISAIVNTTSLVFFSLVISVLISFLLGWTWSNYVHSKLVTLFIKGLSFISIIPLFLAAFIIALLSKYFIINIDSETIKLSDQLSYYLVPVLVLSIFDGLLNDITTFIKHQIDYIKKEPFIISIELRGGNPQKHILKHILFDLLIIIKSKYIHLLSATIVVEIIFGWIGLGYLGYNSVLQRDYNLFLAVIITTSILIIIFNFIVQVSTTLMHPIERRQLLGVNAES